MPVVEPKGTQEANPREYRNRRGSHLQGRTEDLLGSLKSHGLDTRQTWLDALSGLVIRRNESGDFDDVFAHPLMNGSVDPQYGAPLEDLSIAEISVLYEFLLAQEDMKSKRKNGQFFTPDDIALFMARCTRDFPGGVWLDPCCGVGNLSHWLIASQRNSERFLVERCRFLDLDEIALLTARVLKALSFQDKEQNLFTRLEPNFAQGDFLEDSLLNSPAFAGEYDFVLMNPPYVQATDTSGRFESAPSRDLYAFFMEMALRHARGMVSITPQSFTNGRRHQNLRGILLNGQSRTQIYCFDNVPDTVFRGYKFGSENTNQVNSTRAAITVTRRVRASSDAAFSVTPLLRWRSGERSRLLETADRYLTSPSVVSPEIFPKIPPDLKTLYDDLSDEKVCLEDLAEVGGSSRCLAVPTTPRYFISAVKRTLNRSSQTFLGFASETDRLKAYLILNSSLAYLWWRVRDGGMTLSRETLLSLPIPASLDPGAKEAKLLARALQRSEQANVVVKMNAGKPNQNVKHPPALINRLNAFLAEGYEDPLLALHSNSVLQD